jgi:alkylation response protein AidB-like acyl-CoA dehydrogenase
MGSAVHSLTDYRPALGTVVDSVIAPSAIEVDRTGAYPRAVLDALGAAGLLGLFSSAELGGGNGSIADVAEVVETSAATGRLDHT